MLLECRAQLTPGATAASSELELSRWRSEAQRAEARAASAEAQRDRLFARLIEAERLHAGLSGEGGDVDLASFIAELRSELARLEQARDAAERQRSELLAQLRDRGRAVEPADSVAAWAERLSDQGLIPDPSLPLSLLERDLLAGSPAERALLQGVIRDLSAGTSPETEPLREAAADRLGALPPGIAAPVFAAALSREQSPAVLAKLIRGAGLTRVGSLRALLAPLQQHADARVRAALLFAEVRLAPAAPAGHWLTDPAPRVRRRAALAVALHAPAAAGEMLELLATDSEPGVREAVAAGAAALSPTPTALLLRLAQDVEVRVRRAALRALSAPATLADVSPAERRRELRHWLCAPVAAPAPADADVEPTRATPAVPVTVWESVDPAPAVNAGPPAHDRAAPPPVSLDALEQELRASLRGRTLDQLAQALSVPERAVSAALAATPERFEARNHKWFVR